MSHRKHFHFGTSSCVSLEFTWWTSPSFYFRLDGGEHDATLHIGIIVGLWITLSRIFPSSWYPTRKSETYGVLSDEREFKIGWHSGSVWWNFWISEERTGSMHFFHFLEFGKKDPRTSWRYGVWNVWDQIRGKHTHEKSVVESHKYVLPFEEGLYAVTVEKVKVVDRWKRWFTRRLTCFDMKVGVTLAGRPTSGSIPHEGKGENGWDCGLDGTYSLWFCGDNHSLGFRDRRITTCWDAALYMWVHCMQVRANRAHANWVPHLDFVKTRRVDLARIGGSTCMGDTPLGRFVAVDSVRDPREEKRAHDASGDQVAKATPQ